MVNSNLICKLHISKSLGSPASVCNKSNIFHFPMLEKIDMLIKLTVVLTKKETYAHNKWINTIFTLYLF